MKQKILITGVAGFIGYSLANSLLNKKKIVVYGIDNFDPYYSVLLKKKRIKQLNKFKNFNFRKINICDLAKLKILFKKNKFDKIFHFAAQAGVRYSLTNPKNYIDNNINGFFNILECCREKTVKTIYYASSSSVYGDLDNYPAKESFVGIQKNAYSLSKKFNEDLAEVYSKLYNINLIGFRFFTVYGEWGRPDMFYLNYFKSMFQNKIVKIFNYGRHYRDFTYIKDVVEIIERIMKKKVNKKHLVFNICSNKPINLMEFVSIMNKVSKKKCKIKKVQLQKVDVIKTHGDNTKILKFIGKKNFYSINEGLNNTFKWFIKNRKII